MYFLDRVSRLQDREKRASAESRSQSWKYKEAKVCRAKYQKRENCSEREFWRAS